jgi:hypothetical protein
MDLSFLLGLVTTGTGLLGGKPRKRGAREAWQAAAETYGLLHKPAGFWSGPKLSGPLSGNQLTVDMKNRNTASAATRFRLAMRPLNLGLRLKRKGFWNSLKPRTVTGDKAFDNQVVVEARNGPALREFLTPERRTTIQSFLASFKGAVVADDAISLTTRGYVKEADEMLGAIDAMLRVAHVLSNETRSPAVERSEGARAPTIARTDKVDAVSLAPDLESEVAHPDESDPELADVRADESEQRKELEVEATARSDSPIAQQNTPSVEEFCAKVFAPGALSFSANQIFKESYHGERIVWTGTLESITPFNFDFDFGSGRGTKAVLTILESDAVGSRKVQAVIGLAPGIEGLEHRIGQSVSFAGQLLKVDGLAKRVVIADAELQS